MPKKLNPNNYYGWRKLVFIRDKYKCTKCGTGDKLEAHHIKSYSKNKELKFDINNGITLCNDCHRETDSYGSKVRKLKNG